MLSNLLLDKFLFYVIVVKITGKSHLEENVSIGQETINFSIGKIFNTMAEESHIRVIMTMQGIREPLECER